MQNRRRRSNRATSKKNDPAHNAQSKRSDLPDGRHDLSSDRQEDCGEQI